MARKPKTPIDLDAVREARAELERLAEQYPEAFAPDRLPTTAAKVKRALRTDQLVNLSLRVSASTRAELDARAEAAGKRTSDIARELIEHGLKGLAS